MIKDSRGSRPSGAGAECFISLPEAERPSTATIIGSFGLISLLQFL